MGCLYVASVLPTKNMLLLFSRSKKNIFKITCNVPDMFLSHNVAM